MTCLLLEPATSGLAESEAPLVDRPSEAVAASPAESSELPPIPVLELMKEEESVSVAARYAQPISEAPSNVYVITDEDIRHSGAVDLPTVLRRIPGIEVMQVTGADFNVSVRGDNQLQANKMLVMVDGRSIYVDSQGSVFWKALPITLPEIKRIEVLKGPAAVVYGFNAFDGVINIITKSPEDMKGTTLQFGGGEFGTVTSSAVHAGRIGDLGYRLSLGHDQSGQWRDREALAFRASKFNVHTEYPLANESKVLFSGGLVDSNRFDGNLVATATPNGMPQQGYADISYVRPGFFIRGWWQSFATTTNVMTHPLLAGIFQNTNRDLSPILKDRASTYNLEAQHTIQVGASNSLTYGANYRNNTISDNFIAAASREERFGLYLQDEWRATEALRLVAGVRYDLHTEINATVSPRVALIYRIAPEHTVRLAGSVGYRPPTLIETNLDVRSIITLPGVPPPFGTTIVPTAGSHNLHPEQIDSYEAEYQGWYLKHRLRLRAALFFNHITNLITFRQVGGMTTAVNGREADIYGGEAGVEFLATSWLSGFANYSYQEIGQTFTGETRRGGPRFKVNAGLRGEWENGLNGEIAYHYYGAATYPISEAFSQFANFGVVPPDGRVGSYNLLNLRGGYRFWQQKAAAGYLREAEVAVSAFNALNDKHREHPLGDMLSSRVMGWLTLKF